MVTRLNEAIDEVRPEGATRMEHDGYEPVLERSGSAWLRGHENFTDAPRDKLADVIQYDMRSVRTYLSPTWSGKSLDRCCWKMMQSRLDPMKKRAHPFGARRELPVDWFRANGEVSAGDVECLNNKVNVTFRRSSGFRTFDAAEISRYHGLGRLPEPEATHKFF